MKNSGFIVDMSIFGGCRDMGTEMKKEFDAVNFMREQRKTLSEKMTKMTRSEIVAYFKRKQSDSGVKPGA